MPLSFVGSAAPNADPFAITGIPFAPKALVAWFIDSTTEDSFVSGIHNSYGFACNNGGTQERSIGMQHNDNVGTTVERQSWHVGLLGYTNNGGATVKINVTAWTSDGFTVTGANGKRFGYLALGGSDLTNVAVVEDDWPTSGATFTVVGTGFQPDCVLFLTGAITALSADIGNVSRMRIGFGCASSTSDQWSTCVSQSPNGATMSSSMRDDSVFSQDSAMTLIVDNGDTVDAKAPIASFDSDGVTMTNSNAPTDATRVFMLALKGGQYKAGSAAASTSSGNQTFNFNTPTFTPTAVVLAQTPGTASNTVIAATEEMTLGASDGTNEGYGGLAGVEAVNTTEDKYRSVTKSVAQLAPGGTPAVTRSGDTGTFGSGSFVINWSATGAARLTGFLAIGVEPSLAPDTLKYQRQRLRISRRSSI